MGNNDQPERKTSLTFEIADGSVDSEPREDKAPEPKVVKEDISVPLPPFVHDPMRVNVTYVPRFTGASENYRMADDKRLKTERPAPQKEKTEDAIDPTAEVLDETSEGKVILTTGAKSNLDSYSDESIRIYKFSGGESAPDQPNRETVEEDNTYDDVLPVSSLASEKTPEEEPLTAPLSEEPKEEEVVEHPEPPRRIFVSDSLSETRSEDEPIEQVDRGGKRAQNEFKASIQRDAVKDKFIDTLLSVKIRLAFAVLLLIGAVVFEFIVRFNKGYFEAVNISLGTLPVIDLVISSALMLIALPEIIYAIANLMRGRTTYELFLPVSYLLLIGFTSTVILVGDGEGRAMTLSVLYGVQVIVALLGSYLKVSADFSAFKLVSRGEVKKIVDKRLTRTLERENMALDGVIDEYDSYTARVFKTAFVSDFVYNSSRVRENKRGSLIVLLSGLLAGLLVGALSLLFKGNSYPVIGAYETLLTVFLVSAPAFAILAHKLSYRHALAFAKEEKSTFVGEEALFEASDIDVVGYDDIDVFTKEDVTLKKVHLYGKVFNTVKAMREMYSIFSSLGGPLLEVFSSALDRKCSPATDVTVENDGITGTFEGHTVMAGTEAFMRRHNVVIPEDDYKTKTFATDSTKVMYGAEDGEVYVKFFIRYSFSEEFTMILPELKKNGITPLIYTRDPNVDCELFRMLTLGEDIIRVVKLREEKGEEKVYRKLSSGIVSVGDKENIVNTVLLSKKYKAFHNTVACSEMLAFGLGAVFATVIALVFGGRLYGIPSSILALWQVFGCSVFWISSRMIFNVKRKHKG